MAKIVATVATQVARHAFRISVRLVITKERVAEPFGGVTIVAMGPIDADVIETVQANERCLTPPTALIESTDPNLKALPILT